MTIMIIYTDDTIITWPNENEVDQVIKDIASFYEVTTNNKVAEFRGVNIETNNKTGELHLPQTKLIQSILKDLGLNDQSKRRKTPAPASIRLHAYPDSRDFNESCSYRAVIGKLNYLEKSTCLDIAYAVHQCARISINPKERHG
jgi:hypothetical protein